MVLRGLLHAAREEYKQQAGAILEGIGLLRQSDLPDMGMMSAALAMLSAMGREFHLPKVVEAVPQLEPILVWTEDLATERFQVFRLLAWAEAMNGRLISAIQHWNRARDFAKSSGSRLITHVDRAWIASLSNERISAKSELVIADYILRNEPLDNSGDEPAALAYMAEVMAEYHPARAKSILKQAKEMLPLVSADRLFKHDRILGALFSFSEAVVRAANGNRRLAIHRAEEALNIFDDVGYKPRAARAALLLHRLTGKNKWLDFAADVRTMYPRKLLSTGTCKAGGAWP